MCLRTCFTRLCGQRPGAMVGQIRTRESECFIRPAAEPGSGSLAPLETTSFDPLSDGTLHVRSANRAACACTATPGFSCYPQLPHVPPGKLPRGGSSTQSLGRAVVGRRGGSSSDNQHRGGGDWLRETGREESIVEADCQLVQQRPGGLDTQPRARATTASAARLLLDDRNGRVITCGRQCTAFRRTINAVTTAQGRTRRTDCPWGCGRACATGVAVLPASLLPLFTSVGVRMRTCAMAWRVVEMWVVAQELVEKCVRLLVDAVVAARPARPGSRAAGRAAGWSGKFGGFVTCTAALDACIPAVHLQQAAGFAVLRPQSGRRLRWGREGRCWAATPRARS